MYSTLIRGAVEFERCLPESVSCIRATTRRMALRDALETSRNVRQMAEEYASELDAIMIELERGRVVHLRQQPVFEWEIDGRAHFSANWRFEQMMIQYIIMKDALNEGKRVGVEGDYKSAKKSFLEAAEICDRVNKNCISQWPFRDMATLNLSNEDFWHCQKQFCEAYGALMTLQFAIQEKKTKLLSYISKKMYGHASLALFQHEDAKKLHDLAVLVFAYSKADTLWSAGRHGEALGMLQWQHMQKPTMDEASSLATWFEEQEDIFDSWRTENSNVYFAEPKYDAGAIEEVTEKKEKRNTKY